MIRGPFGVPATAGGLENGAEMQHPAGTAGGTVPPPGWEQMTPVEREQYQRDLRDTKSAEECRILNSRTQQQMTQRARERGEPLPPSRGVDLCAR